MNEAKEGGWANAMRTLRDNAGGIIATFVILLVAVVALVLATGLLETLEKVKDSARSAWHNFRSEETYVVLAVFPDSTVSSPMVRALGFSGNERTTSLSTNPRVDLVRFDEQATWEATSVALKRRLEESPEVVLVIGHERSTTVKELLPVVYRPGSDGPIPLILPAVTNPDLTRVSDPNLRHVLRLPATDDKQVDALRALLERLPESSRNVMLLGDNGNREYSAYIIRELVARGLSLPIVDVQGIDLFSGGFGPERFLTSNPRTMIFAGMELEAILLTRRLKAVKKVLGVSDLVLVLTDGAAGEHLQRALRTVLTPNDYIFITGPFPAPVRKGAVTDFPTYAPYATAAKMIATRLVERAARAGGLSRKSVRNELQAMSGDNATYSMANIAMNFNSNGDNTNAIYHVYELRSGSVTHSCLCSCSIASNDDECGDG